MSEYLFVLGKNPKLSIAEIESYLEKSSLKNKIIEETANFAIFDINEHIEKDLINHLGGTLKIAKIEKKIPKKDLLEKEIENIELNGSGKYFGISLYPEDKPHNSDFKLVKKISMLIKKKTKPARILSNAYYPGGNLYKTKSIFSALFPLCRLKELRCRVLYLQSYTPRPFRLHLLSFRLQ